MFFSKKVMKDNRLNGLLGFTGVSTVLVSTAMQFVAVSGFRVVYDDERHALYIELRDGIRFYFSEIWKFIRALFSAWYTKNNSGGQSSAGNEIKGEQAPVGDGSVKNVKDILNINVIENAEEVVDPSNTATENAEEVVNLEFEEERKKLEEDIAFLKEQKDSKNCKKYMKNSHKGETDLIRKFHFDVMYVLARRVTWLRHKDIPKKIDDFNRNLLNKFGIDDLRDLYGNLEQTLEEKTANLDEKEKNNYSEEFCKILENESKDFSMFEKLFGKEEKEFKIFKQKCELYCSDEYKEIYKMYLEDLVYRGLDKSKIYNTCYDVSEFSEKEVEEALKKFPEYKKKYLDLVNENSKKSEFYVKYVPEFFKLSDESTPDEILDCYINWWKGCNSNFDNIVSLVCPNKENIRLKESGAISRLFNPWDGWLETAFHIVAKAKEDVDFCKEYAEKEKTLEEREKALELKEKQYRDERLAALVQGSNENFGSFGS